MTTQHEPTAAALLALRRWAADPQSTTNCQQCGTPLDTPKRYCSNACRCAAYRYRKHIALMAQDEPTES